jgi:hypothetical protein
MTADTTAPPLEPEAGSAPTAALSGDAYEARRQWLTRTIANGARRQ